MSLVIDHLSADDAIGRDTARHSRALPAKPGGTFCSATCRK